MNRLQPKHIFFLSLALSFLVLGLWYTFRYQARQQEITTLKSDIELATTKSGQYRQAQAQLPQLRQEVGNLRAERAAFVAALPKNNQMAQLLSEMRGNAQATGTQIQSVNVAVTAPDGSATLPGGVQPIPVTMNMSGTYTQVFRTLRAMETMNRFTTIRKLDLQLPQATSFDPDLTGTLEMTVYTFDPTLAAPPPAEAASGAATAPAPTPAEGASQ